jgi:rRNA-processing protein CGR1
MEIVEVSDKVDTSAEEIKPVSEIVIEEKEQEVVLKGDLCEQINTSEGVDDIANNDNIVEETTAPVTLTDEKGSLDPTDDTAVNEDRQDAAIEETEAVKENVEPSTNANSAPKEHNRSKDVDIMSNELDVDVAPSNNQTNDDEVSSECSESLHTNAGSAKSFKYKMLLKAEIIPRQKPKSGKFWKAGRSQFNAIKKDRGPRLTFEQRLKRKEDAEKAKGLAEMMTNKKMQRKQQLRENIEANKKKKEENEKRAEVYQVIKNPAKIKRMKKKQLKLLAKRDTVEVRPMKTPEL